MTQQRTSVAEDSRRVMAAVERASREHGIGIAEIMGHVRTAPISQARHDAIMYARDEGISLPRIADALNKHHTSIMHGDRQARLRRYAEKARREEADRMQDFKQWRNPVWHHAQKVHDWRNYAGDDLRKIWDTLTSEQQRAVYLSLDNIAGKEDWE